MTTVPYLRRVPAVRYDGTNGVEVSTFANVPIVSDTGPGAGPASILQLGDPTASPPWVAYTFQVGDYFDSKDQAWWYGPDFESRHITEAAALLDTNNNAQVATNTANIATNTTNIATNTTAIAGLTSSLAGKLGKVDLVSISTPILLLGGTADRAIVWNRAFNNTSYDLSFAFDASTIGRITCSVVAGTKTTTGVTIRVSAALAVSVLGVVHVLGIGA
jgi:hypothetical protein